MNARGSAMPQPNILRNLSLDVTQATLELLLDLGHLIVAAVKPPKTFDTDKADANEAATACTSGQTRQHLLKSACQDNSRLKVDDPRHGTDTANHDPGSGHAVNGDKEDSRDELRPSTQALQFGLSLKRSVRMRLGNALPRHFSLFQLIIVPRLSILKAEAASCSTTQAALAAAPRNFSAQLFSCASLHLSPTGPIPAHDRSSPPDSIRSALVESENEALSYSTRIDELTTRISMN
ncbi:hypothetical protein ACJA88_014446 [Fusarium oxysporum]